MIVDGCEWLWMAALCGDQMFIGCSKEPLLSVSQQRARSGRGIRRPAVHEQFTDCSQLVHALLLALLSLLHSFDFRALVLGGEAAFEQVIEHLLILGAGNRAVGASLP